ncbi:hypothetical protein KW790_01380 [Candidatus Parcubacteria bacterium]|nr:hypothetical protein [Candidatus Parcubacteria bacterium]
MYKLFLVWTLPVFLFTSFAFTQTTVQAQVDIPEVPDEQIPTDITLEPISFLIVPETPAPGDLVTVSIESTNLDLDSAIMRWTVNGGLVKSGKGIKQINVTNGGSGSQTTVSVSISSGGATITRSTTFGAGNVDLLWQGDTYAPPFYAGRHLWTHGSRLTLLAIPDSSLGSASALIYRWSQSGTILGASSGAGRSSLSFYDSILSLPQDISVDVMTDQDTVVATKTIHLQPTDVTTLLYEDNPLIGLLLNKEVDGSYGLTDKEVTFSAMPMFYSVQNRTDKRVSYTWSTNSGAANTGNHITLRIPDNSSGQAQVGVNINNSANLLQTASKSFLVKFGNTPSF